VENISKDKGRLNMKSNRTSKSGSVEKALQILEVFDEKNPYLSLEEISKLTGFSKSSAFRMICSLENFGYLKRGVIAKTVQFSLGYAYLEKAQLVSNQLNIKELAKDEMVNLRNETGLTVQLAIREGENAIYIEQFESLNPIRLYPQIGRKAPLYSAACPRTLLAYLPDDEQEELLKRFKYHRFTKNTITDPEEVKRRCNMIRKNGYELSEGELHESTIAIATPIFGLSNNAIASLSLVGLEGDFEGKKSSLIRSLLQKASIISNKLHV
jgi:IclR family KDG regulon transcriptional repressor